MIRSLAVAGVLLVATGTPAPSPRAAVPPLAAAVGVAYAAPVPTPFRVVHGFEPPSSPYGPGHRGVDLATTAGDPVRAAGNATVRFAGRVAGRGVVVLAHPDGITTEYEPVRPAVRVGDAVVRGQVIGTISGTHGECRPDGCLHWGAKRGDEYFDPLTLLQPLGPVRLLPWSAAGRPTARAMIGACVLPGIRSERCRGSPAARLSPERSPP